MSKAGVIVRGEYGATEHRSGRTILLGVLALVLGALSFWGVKRLTTPSMSGSPERPSAPAAQIATPNNPPAAAASDAAQILIQYKRAIPEAEKQRIRSQASVVLVRKIDTPYLQMDVVAPTSQKVSAVDLAVSQISKNPNVQFAEVQQKYSHEPNPN